LALPRGVVRAPQQVVPVAPRWVVALVVL